MYEWKKQQRRALLGGFAVVVAAVTIIFFPSGILNRGNEQERLVVPIPNASC